LLLRNVLALPNSSKMGVESRMHSDTRTFPTSTTPSPEDRLLRYESTILAVSVLPAPDSPLMTMDWEGGSDSRGIRRFWYASCMRQKH